MREKLIELLLGRKEVVSEICENTSCKTCQYEKYGFNCDNAILADHLIANGVTVQEWISVKDRLPEENKHVLANREGVISVEFRWGCGWSYDHFTKIPVTHWMPLPQPPKGE